MPGTKSSVIFTSIDFAQGAERMPVIVLMSAAGWFTPGCGSERQIGRPPVPPFQPMRTAVTVNVDAFVETYKPTKSPRCTLTRSVNPRTLSHTAALSGAGQVTSPGLRFSSAMVGRRASGTASTVDESAATTASGPRSVPTRVAFTHTDATTIVAKTLTTPSA